MYRDVTVLYLISYAYHVKAFKSGLAVSSASLVSLFVSKSLTLYKWKKVSAINEYVRVTIS